MADAETRGQWGREIGRFRAVKRQLADLALLDAAHTTDAQLPDLLDATAMAKSHLTDAYLRAAARRDRAVRRHR